MKYLQDLVPGCNKITGKAGMLDEIINYVQSLQRQVEVCVIYLLKITSEISCFFALQNKTNKLVITTVLIHETSYCQSTDGFQPRQSLRKRGTEKKKC